jgi:electron transport complex protein RnfB
MIGILIPIIALGALGAIFGIGLAIASKKLHVDIDPRLEQIHALLPGANCGACGAPGCFGFAEKLLEGKLPVSNCRVVSDENKIKIAGILGQSLGKETRKTARLHCNGGAKVANRYEYHGVKDCVTANLQMAGFKTCTFGCLGLGTCARACPFGAIHMGAEGLPVIDSRKCKACNKCVLACPKKLISLEPENNPVVVRCRSMDAGKETKDSCPVGCIACKMCEKACEYGAIQVIDNLARIDYEKCTACGACVKACPRKTITMGPKGPENKTS